MSQPDHNWHDALNFEKKLLRAVSFKIFVQNCYLKLDHPRHTVAANSMVQPHNTFNTLVWYMTHAHYCHTSYFTLLRTCCSRLFERHFGIPLRSCQKGSTMMPSVPAFMSKTSSCCWLGIWLMCFAMSPSSTCSLISESYSHSE